MIAELKTYVQYQSMFQDFRQVLAFGLFGQVAKFYWICT